MEIAAWILLVLRWLLRIALRVPTLLIWLLLLGISRGATLRVIILRHRYAHHRLGYAHGNYSNHPCSWHYRHGARNHNWSSRLTRGALWDELSLEVDASSLLSFIGESEPVSDPIVNT